LKNIFAFDLYELKVFSNLLVLRAKTLTMKELRAPAGREHEDADVTAQSIDQNRMAS